MLDRDPAPADWYNPPALELTFECDDPDDPTEVTVYPADGEDPTTWLTIDIEYAIDLRMAV